MNEPFPYEKRDWYPHMKPADIAIWNRFIEKYPAAYEWVEYDLGVGEGPAFSTVVTDATGGDDGELYKKKIDVVGHIGQRCEIIEVKPNAGLGAFGQVLSYEILYLEHINPKADTHCAIITDRLSPDMARLADEHDVEMIVV